MKDRKDIFAGFSLFFFLLLLCCSMGCGGGGGGSSQSPSNDTEAPTVPAGLVASAFTPTQIDLSWNASTDNVGVAGYKMYRNGTYIKSAGAASSSDTGLTPNTQYCHTVSAYDSAGNESAQSEQICITTPPAAPGGGGGAHLIPGPSSLIASVASSQKIDLSWTPPANSDISGYRIYTYGKILPCANTDRKEPCIVPKPFIEVQGTATSNSDTDHLYPDSTYCYSVTAFDSLGNESGHSNQSCATTLPGTALLKTSFEDLSLANPDVVTPPFLYSQILPNAVYSPHYWKTDSRSRSGSIAINLLPTGNPALTPVRPGDKCDATLCDNYVVGSYVINNVFSVSGHATVFLHFYFKRNSTVISPTWADNYLWLMYKRDGGTSWSSAALVDNYEYILIEKNEGFLFSLLPSISEWKEITVPIGIQNASTIEFAFIVNSPVKPQADPGVFFLIDDLRITAD